MIVLHIGEYLFHALFSVRFYFLDGRESLRHKKSSFNR